MPIDIFPIIFLVALPFTIISTYAISVYHGYTKHTPLFCDTGAYISQSPENYRPWLNIRYYIFGIGLTITAVGLCGMGFQGREVSTSIIVKISSTLAAFFLVLFAWIDVGRFKRTHLVLVGFFMTFMNAYIGTTIGIRTAFDRRLEIVQWCVFVWIVCGFWGVFAAIYFVARVEKKMFQLEGDDELKLKMKTRKKYAMYVASFLQYLSLWLIVVYGGLVLTLDYIYT